ncbi:hypothetical protein LCGC14_0579110 [marine sediment metagenome]|uniref:Uncharacterized protein n=1 Tax=marine sediment metagenome TaxID=412755 RepID=A0A0F9S0M0_9ZZZZ
MKKGNIVFVKPHGKYEDVMCGIKKPRLLGGEFYRFVHNTNADTAFVTRVKTSTPYYDGKDRILVPKKELEVQHS